MAREKEGRRADSRFWVGLLVIFVIVIGGFTLLGVRYFPPQVEKQVETFQVPELAGEPAPFEIPSGGYSFWVETEPFDQFMKQFEPIVRAIKLGTHEVSMILVATEVCSKCQYGMETHVTEQTIKSVGMHQEILRYQWAPDGTVIIHAERTRNNFLDFFFALGVGTSVTLFLFGVSYVVFYFWPNWVKHRKKT